MEESKVDAELPHKMAHLDIMEVDEHNIHSAEENDVVPDLMQQRVLRKRKPLEHEISRPSNRRVSMKPRKRAMPDNANRKQIEALYLNKNVKTVSQTLETIYEEPKTENSNSEDLIGGRKVKRLLTFQLGSQYTKDKIKKRRAKIKKLLGSTAFINRKKIPMKMFLETIQCLDLDEVVKAESNTVTSQKLK